MSRVFQCLRSQNQVEPADDAAKLYQFPSRPAAESAYRPGAVAAAPHGKRLHGITMQRETITQCFHNQSGKPRPLYDDDGNKITVGECPVAAHGQAPRPSADRTGRRPSNRRPSRSAPFRGMKRVPSRRSTSRPATPTVDYDAVRRELLHIMDNPSWDDGSLAPTFIRLAWHSSGTYDAKTGTGGSNGAGMRFETEAADPENAGLDAARAFLEPVKKRFPEISYSDLWILAAYVGIEHTGGPVIPFTPGRTDHQDESYWSENNMSYGRLPAAEKYLCPHVEGNLEAGADSEGRINGWENLCTHVRNEVFYRMGFNDQEIVALLCGGHVYGRCHPKASGYAGPWVEHPTQWSNEYATDMLEDDWRLVDNDDTWLDEQGSEELRPAPGNRQYVNQKPAWEESDPDADSSSDSEEPNQMMLPTDMILAWDPDFREHLEVYAEDEDRLTEDFGKAFKKLTELGCGFEKQSTYRR